VEPAWATSPLNQEKERIVATIGVHEMARENEALKEENGKLKEEISTLKTKLMVCNAPAEMLNKLREAMLSQLKQAKDNIIRREEEIDRMINEGAPCYDEP
jgi:chromosome segregation ATPase